MDILKIHGIKNLKKYSVIFGKKVSCLVESSFLAV